MSVLGLWILVSLLGCCIGYAIPSAQYYDYQTQPYTSQWQPLPYQLDYQPFDYQSSYYNSYYNSYYYPYPYKYAEYKKPYQKPLKDLEHGLSYEEAQKFLQVYRLIRVIVLFRTPPKKLTLLDKLVKRLTKQSLQDQLVELVCHLEGYEEVAELDHKSHGAKLDIFVDDTAKLLQAIQNALNALDLDEYEYDHHHHHHGGHGCCEVHEELCEELRQLRDQANELSVPLIKKHRVQEIKAMVKQALDSDILEDLDEDLESRLLELDYMDLDMPVIAPNEEVPLHSSYEKQIPGGLQEHMFIDSEEQMPDVYEEHMPVVYQEPIYREYPKQIPQSRQYDEQKLNQFATVLHAYFQQQSTTEPPQVHQKETVQTSTTNYPKMAATTVKTSATTVNSQIAKEDTNSWFGTLFGKGNAIPGTIDVSEPAVLMEPGTAEQSVPEKVVDNDVIAFDIDQRIQAISNTEKSNSASAFFSAPLWLSKSADVPAVENKESGPSFLNKVDEMLLKEFAEHRQVTVNATKVENGKARDLPDEEEELDQDDDGPIRLDMFKLKEATHEVDFIDPEKEPFLESRDQLSPKSDARRVVKEEVIKVLNLLEEAFSELHGRISESDVDKLVDGLRDVEAGVRWTEMLSAVQKMITEKKLSSNEQILDVLENWKENETGQINNGYFERTYGGQTTKATVD